MDWKRAAIDDLRQYPLLRESLRNIPERIRALESSYQAVKCANADPDPVQGGTSRVEDNMLNNIVKRQRLHHTYIAAKRLVVLIQRGLAGLDDNERRVLDRFYIDRRQGHVEQLMNDLHLEQAQVYRIKDMALYKFTKSMYGITDY